MNSSETSSSGYEIDFGGGAEGDRPPDKLVMEPYIRARIERTEVQKRFFRRENRTATDLHELVEAMVAFDRIRAGRMWNDSDTDLHVERYRKALSTDLSKMDFARLRPRRNLPSRLEDLQHVHHDRKSRIVDPRATGWYYEKHFDYSARSNGALRTFERFTDVTLGGEISGTNRHPALDDHFQFFAETGRWFDYVVEDSGYINGGCIFQTGFRNIKRAMFPLPTPGDSVIMQSIDGAVGLFSGNKFIGRQYLQLDTGSYTGNGRDAAASLNDHLENQIGGFVMNGSAHVEKGERIKVMLGIRVKAFAGMRGPGASVVSEIRAYPTAFSVGTIDVLPPAPAQW